MRNLVLLSLLIIHTISLSAKEITDMAGRSVEIPDNIERIMPYDVKTSILLFPIAQEKMVAKALLPGSKQKEFISNKYNAMLEVDMKNIESVLACNPQIIIAGNYKSDNNYEKYEKLQKRTHIPVVIIDFSIDELDKTYSFLGTLLDNEEQCSECTLFLQHTYNTCDSLINSNPQVDANVYYSIGSSGLMTDPVGSKHTEVLDYLKLNNVVKVDIPTGGHVNVNMEQVMIWNPDYIFTAGFKADKNAYSMMKTSARWKSISAVEKGNIYKVPSQPFGWFDHPPTVNRIPGIIWLTQVFYKMPAKEVQKQIIEFYKLFYHYELSTSEYLLLFE